MGKDTVWGIRIRRVQRWWPFVLVVLVPMLWGMTLIWASVRGPYPTQERLLREAIHSSMKDPSSARIGPVQWDRMDQFLRARGWVYGTNSFGATVRQNYQAWFGKLRPEEPFVLVDLRWEK